MIEKDGEEQNWIKKKSEEQRRMEADGEQYIEEDG